MLVHILIGCCGHHTHSYGLPLEQVAAGKMQIASDHADSHGPAEHQPDHDGCDGDHCVFLLTRGTVAVDWIATPLWVETNDLLDPSLGAPNGVWGQRHPASCPPAHLPRYLLNQVLLI